MGCSLSCACFEAFSSFLEWVVGDVSSCRSVFHYLDDFLCIGLREGNVCSLLLHTVERVAVDLGVPMAPEKTEGPSTVLSFLGMTIDNRSIWSVVYQRTSLGSCRQRWGGIKKIQLWELQSLLGKFYFACRIMPMGKLFSCRLAAEMGCVVACITMGHELRGLSAGLGGFS